MSRFAWPQRRLGLLGLLLGMALAVQASEPPRVSGLATSVDGTRVTIQYDIKASDASPAEVFFYIRNQQTETWVQPEGASGDLGPGVTPGNNRRIEWDPLAHFADGFSGKLQFRVVTRAEQALNEELATCQAHLKANRLTTGRGGNAADCFQAILEAYSGQPEALAGLRQIEERYARWAAAALDRNQAAKADTYLDRLAKVNPESSALAELRERLAKASNSSSKHASGTSDAEVSRKPYEPEMVAIPAGSFRMGDLSGEGDDDEKPVHRVEVEAFALGKYEVTKAQFAAFIKETGYRTDAERNHGGKKGCYAYQGGEGFGWTANTSWRDPGFKQRPSEPVVCVSWNDARAYIQWLNRKTSESYRLPTEAEWEYAARAGTSTKHSFGDDEGKLCQFANVADQTAKKRFSGWTIVDCNDGQLFTAPVGSYAPNPWGLHDLHGNVWEWTQDCWNDSYKGAPRDGSAWKSGGCGRRVARGGSWGNLPRSLRAADRDWFFRDGRLNDQGFRVSRAR